MKTCFVILLLSFFYSFSEAQDLMIIGKLDTKPVKAKILSSNSDKLKYIDIEINDTNYILLKSIQYIKLDTVDEIGIYEMKKLQIQCLIESVGIHYIRYRDIQSGMILNIVKDNVFACQFNDSCISSKLNTYFSIYTEKVLNRVDSKKITVIKNNSMNLSVQNLQFIDSFVSFEMLDNEKVINTFTKRSEIKKIYFSSNDLTASLKHGKDFILTRKGSIFKECTINKITNDHVFFDIDEYSTAREITAPKDKICALLFNNFEKDISNSKLE
jgi:hypothetical protein